VTSLLVQDGGVPGAVWNIAGLVVLGVLAEQACRRGAWLAAYLGAGLVGELVGWAGWQPVGAGNSVAVCGLAALLAVTTARDTGLPAGFAVAAAIWSLAVGAGPYLPAPVLVGAMIACGLAGRVPAVVGPGRIAVAVVAGSALFGITHADIHGAALAAGLVGVVGAWLCGVPVRPARERSDEPVRL
jgi:rhomboid protease GluP